MLEDLAFHEGPISDLFPRPKTSNEWERLSLNDSQLDHFRLQGYIAGIKVLEQDHLEVLRQELAAIARPDHPGHSLYYEFHLNESGDPDAVLFHALGAWRISPAFHDILWHPAILRPASQLLDGAVRFWHDQLFCKPARQGGGVAWHQDYSYWTRTTPMNHLTCWIGLDDSNQENGCLRYVPGSHQWNLLPITGLAGRMDNIDAVLTKEQQNAFQPVSIELKAGECSFHHPLMVHGSDKNRSDSPRRGMVLNFVKDGVCSSQNEPLLEGIDPIPAGEPLQGRFFPLLYDPDELFSEQE